MKSRRRNQKVSFHISISKDLKDRVEQHSDDIAETTGWSKLTPQEGKGPNDSATGEELLEIGLAVKRLWGDDWQDNLQVQSEPLWVKKNFGEILDYLKGMETMTQVERVDAIHKMKTDLDLDPGDLIQ